MLLFVCSRVFVLCCLLFALLFRLLHVVSVMLFVVGRVCLLGGCHVPCLLCVCYVWGLLFVISLCVCLFVFDFACFVLWLMYIL